MDNISDEGWVRGLDSFSQRMRGITIAVWQRKFKLSRWRRTVLRSLALNRRGEARRDGLALIDVRERLEIRWRARAVHPWDRNLPDGAREAAFVEQSLADTEAAIRRLFDAFPGVEIVEVKVLDVESDQVAIEGAVWRSELSGAAGRHSSIRMRLRQLGIREYLSETV